MEIQGNIEAAAHYSWSAKATLRHLDPSKDNMEVQFGNLAYCEDECDLEAAVLEIIVKGCKIEFGDQYNVVPRNIVVWFHRASDSGLS